MNRVHYLEIIKNHLMQETYFGDIFRKSPSRHTGVALMKKNTIKKFKSIYAITFPQLL